MSLSFANLEVIRFFSISVVELNAQSPIVLSDMCGKDLIDDNVMQWKIPSSFMVLKEEGILCLVQRYSLVISPRPSVFPWLFLQDRHQP